MTRALVLGGGGPVGIGWEAGLLVGLDRAGVDLAAADAVIGTSAGSVVGFTLASGGDLTHATALVGSANERGGAGSDPAVAAAAQSLEDLIAAIAEAAGDPGRADAIRAGVGKVALAAATMAEDRWLDMFAQFAGVPWPAGFACTAVSAADGSFRVWDSAAGVDGVDPHRAIASSCAVPGIFPPVTIGGTRWMDGGVRDILNADVASDHDVVLAVSCTLLEVPPELGTPAIEGMFAATRAQLDGLRDAGAKVEAVVPGQEMLDISGFGMELMDFTKAAAAYEAGLRQGAAEATRLSGFWSA